MDTQDVDHVEQAPPPAPKTPYAERDEEGDDAGSDQDDTAPAAGDPYSNLDGAFGNYMADEPRPMAASGRGGRPNDDDDLLF